MFVWGTEVSYRRNAKVTRHSDTVRFALPLHVVPQCFINRRLLLRASDIQLGTYIQKFRVEEIKDLLKYPEFSPRSNETWTFYSRIPASKNLPSTWLHSDWRCKFATAWERAWKLVLQEDTPRSLPASAYRYWNTKCSLIVPCASSCYLVHFLYYVCVIIYLFVYCNKTLI